MEIKAGLKLKLSKEINSSNLMINPAQVQRTQNAISVKIAKALFEKRGKTKILFIILIMNFLITYY